VVRDDVDDVGDEALISIDLMQSQKQTCLFCIFLKKMLRKKLWNNAKKTANK